jgi:hypothetical protein
MGTLKYTWPYAHIFHILVDRSPHTVCFSRLPEYLLRRGCSCLLKPVQTDESGEMYWLGLALKIGQLKVTVAFLHEC